MLPLFLTLTLGTADGGRAFFYREAVTNAARQALRVAVSAAQESTGDTACAGSGVTPSAVSVSTTLPAAGTSAILTIADAAAQEGSSNGLPSGTNISGAKLTVTWHCLSGKAITNATATTTDPGSSTNGSDSVEVKITYRFTLITPLVSRLMNNGNPTIGADVFGRSEY